MSKVYNSCMWSGCKVCWTPPTQAERDHLLKCADAKWNGKFMTEIDPELWSYLFGPEGADNESCDDNDSRDARILESLAYDGL